MTTEEAIEYWEGLRKTFSSQLEKEENYFGRMHLQTTIDVLDTTISALRAQQSRGKLLRRPGGIYMDNEGVYIPPISQPPCVECGCGWGSISNLGYESCHDTCEKLATYRAQQEKDICGCTNLECASCTPGPCEHRKQPNDPLTLDELRRMGGEPVWIVWPDGRIKSKWWIVGNYDWRMMEFDEWRDYGKTWVAYRRKLEEVQK